MKLALFPNKCE